MLKLQCKITGFPAPTIKWLRDGNEIKVIDEVKKVQDRFWPKIRAVNYEKEKSLNEDILMTKVEV